MPDRDVIVVGASAGAVEVLVELVRGLPAGFPAAVFIVMHVPAEIRSHLPDILSRKSRILARHAHDGEPIHPGHVYVAPPDHHLMMEPGVVRVNRGPRENHFRPSIDPLFRSAARSYGGRVIGVILSGALSDGVAGLMAVRSAGGVAVVQDPDDARMPNLPRTARDVAGADHVVTAAALPALLIDLVRQNPCAPGEEAVDDAVDRIIQTATDDLNIQAETGRPGGLSVFTCPECGGCMWQVGERELVRFRCHVGHAYQADALLVAQSSALEAALWTAVRTFKEKSVLTSHLANRERESGNVASAERFEEESRLAAEYGELIKRDLLHSTEGQPHAPIKSGSVSGPGGGARRGGR